TRTLKFRGSMALLGMTRVFGLYRMANMMALLDHKVRGVDPAKAEGGVAWDSYTWHTDLPPGHPMVTGQQTVDFDLFAAEYAKLITIWGMNWISTKMPDGHWLTEARMKGTKVTVIATDYQSTANKADRVINLRPGTDTALALGCSKHIIDNGLYDVENVKRRTDLPLLVRMDNNQLLRGRDIIAGYAPAPLSNYTRVLGQGEAPPANHLQNEQYIPRAMREQWDDFVVWDQGAGAWVVTRDQVGGQFPAGVDPVLTGTYTVTTVDGATVKVRPVFDLMKQYLDANFDLQTTSEVTWVPQQAIVDLATEIAANKQKTLFVTGIGPNHFFNADLKDRAIFLLAALTDNIGHLGGNVGSYAGNYRAAVFNGAPQWISENPFDIELDPAKKARVKKYNGTESAHYWNYGDRPLRVGNKNFTGKGHMPTPTKLAQINNGNSILGNAKWHHDLVQNTLPKMECIIIQEWWWTASCEYADIVFPVDSWAELKIPDMSASVTNPFLYVYPRTPMKRLFDTRQDMEVFAGIGQKLAEIHNEVRFRDYWKFVLEGKVETYLQRMIDLSSSSRGYKWEDLEAKAAEGIPALMNMRTYPRSVGWEQVYEDKPWYNRSGRLEFYRDEPEWLEYGENLVVWREPVDGTHLEPNVIMARPHPAINPKGPEAYGIDSKDLSAEVRQVRNVVKSWDELKVTKHPLAASDPRYRFVFITPKFRHGAHTTPIDTDYMSLLFGPFGDMYRMDKRKPYVSEGYVELNPKDARELGIEDGDYIWFDADPADRPYRGWKPEDPDYKVHRGMARCRYNNAVQPGVARSWFNMFVATKGSVKGAATRPDGLAKNPETNYQAMFRFGSHQSATRAWLRPTLLTDTMIRKPLMGHTIGAGFEPDVHCANGAPKESFIKIEKAEAGGIDGKGLWRPAAEGFRVAYESEAMKKYLGGQFIR
ncbi:MAG TPA: molybdopterin-dependent oxidoreductase, partial [Symbiobacteriaceae bacterium]|nr:molybdopterin-dependent oxidoreductase [Symbiobacteriaceae bacterium]